MTTFISTKIEFWPVEKLIPYDRNARTHSDEQIEQIARTETALTLIPCPTAKSEPK
jgi:hypothetical protein